MAEENWIVNVLECWPEKLLRFDEFRQRNCRGRELVIVGEPVGDNLKRKLFKTVLWGDPGAKTIGDRDVELESVTSCG